MIFIKKYIFIVIFILLAVIILLLPKDIIHNNVEIDYEMLERKEYNYIYYIENNEVVGIPVYDLKQDRYLLIEEVFKYLTEKSNSVAKEYHTELNLNSKLISYELRGEDIYIEVSDNFFEIDNSLLALAQVLYTYKELGFEEVYIMNNGLVIEQIENIITYDGISELPVNLDMVANQKETKNIKVIYYYKNGKKQFKNHIVNSSEDELKFKIKKILKFIKSEENIDVELVDLIKHSNNLEIYLKTNSEDLDLLKKLLKENLKINDQDIIISHS